MTDTLWSDVSEWQVAVDDSYPYDVLAIRSDDGTYRDRKFQQNYAWGLKALDSRKLRVLIVYVVYRQNWADTLATVKDQITRNGGLRPGVVFMLDVENWGGQITGDQSDGINRLYWGLTDWLGTSSNKGTRRVIGYGNTYDLNSLWPTKPDGIRLVVAAYGSNPDYPGKIAHQFTDGTVDRVWVPPFGYADVNSADGLDSLTLATQLGVYTQPVPNAIDLVYANNPWLGNRITQGSNVTPDGKGQWAQFDNGYIYFNPDTAAHPIPNSVFAKYGALQWETGPLGYPTSDPVNVTGGTVQAFQGGRVYVLDGQEPVWVHGAIGGDWATRGFENGPLGFPVTDEIPWAHGAYQDFQHGRIWYTNNGIVPTDSDNKPLA